MNEKHYIVLDEERKRIKLQNLNESFDLGVLLTDFLELDLTEYQQRIEQIRQFDKRDMHEVLKSIKEKNKYIRGYMPLLLELNNKMTELNISPGECA